MTNLLKPLFFLTLFAVAGPVLAQDIIYSQKDGPYTPLREVSYVATEGSPYFSDEYQWGEATLSNGHTYRGLKLRYDMVAGEVSFKYGDEAPSLFTLPVNAFRFFLGGIDTMATASFIGGLEPVDGSKSKSFYQVLSSGKTRLLKREVRSISSTKAYGSASTVNEVKSAITYYVLKPGENKPIRIRKDKKSVLEALADKRTQLEALLVNVSVDWKTDAGLATLIDYYDKI